MKPSHTTLEELDSLNIWLAEVFGEGKRLSHLLEENGFSEDEIENLKLNHLADFIHAVFQLIASTTDQHDGIRRNEVMMRHYGLVVGGKPETLKSIGDSVGVSRERIRQLVEKRLRSYRFQKRKALFVEALVVRARQLLQENK